MHAHFTMTDHTVEIPNWTVRIPNVPGKEPTILKGTKYHNIGDYASLSDKTTTTSRNCCTRSLIQIGDFCREPVDPICLKTFSFVFLWNFTCFILIWVGFNHLNKEPNKLTEEQKIGITILSIFCTLLLLMVLVFCYNNDVHPCIQLRTTCLGMGCTSVMWVSFTCAVSIVLVVLPYYFLWNGI